MSPRIIGRAATCSATSRCRPETASMKFAGDFVPFMGRSCSSTDPDPHTPRRCNTLLHHVPVHTRIPLPCGSSRDSLPHCQSFQSGIARQNPVSLHSLLQTTSLSPGVGPQDDATIPQSPGMSGQVPTGQRAPRPNSHLLGIRLFYLSNPEGQTHDSYSLRPTPACSKPLSNITHDCPVVDLEVLGDPTPPSNDVIRVFRHHSEALRSPGYEQLTDTLVKWDVAHAQIPPVIWSWRSPIGRRLSP